MTRTFTRRLAAAGVAVLAVLPAVPAVAASPGGERGAAPAARTLDQACPTERVGGTEFGDAAANAHGASIQCLSWYGVTQGGADGTFGVERAVTRAQLATFLSRVLTEAGVVLPTAAPDAFSDDDGNTHEVSLNALAALGVFTGSADGTVSPDKAVRRDQMAAFLVRLLELVTDEELAEAIEDYFEDDDENIHQGPINALAGLGIATGRAKGVFDPSSEVRRDQMATFLMRLIDRLVEHGDVRAPLTLRLSAEEVAPGDVVQAEVLGEGIAKVEVAGCGFDGVVTDTDPDADGVQWSLTVPTAWPVEGEPVTDAPGATEVADGPVATEVGDAPGATEVADGPSATEVGDAPIATETGEGPDEDSDHDGDDEGDEEGDEDGDDDKCKIVVTVTFDDGSTEKLKGKLELVGLDDADDDSDEADSAEDSDDSAEDSDDSADSDEADSDEADSDEADSDEGSDA